MTGKKVPTLLLFLLSIMLFLHCPCPCRAARGGGGGRDRTPPVITILSPAEGEEVESPLVVISGSVIDNVAVLSAELVVNSLPPAPLALDADGNFSAETTLSPGSNTLEVRARDGAENTAARSRSVSFQERSDFVTISSPSDGDVIHGGRIDVTGTFSPPVETIVSIFGPATQGEGTFCVEVLGLAEGTNTVTVSGLDAGGEEHRTSVTVEVTSAGDPLVLRADPPGGRVPLAVTFSLEDFTSETVVAWEMDFDGTGTYTPVPEGIDGLNHTYGNGGLFFPSARVTTREGHRYTARTILSAYGPARFLAAYPAQDPVDLAVGREGNLYILERSAARVRVLDEAGGEIASFGSPGSGPGQFSDPSGIDLDSDGNIYVSDSGNDRVQVFSPSFELVDSWGYSGTRLGEMSRPRGIALEYDGEVALADSGNGRIDRFRGNGYFENAAGAGALSEPWGVAWRGGGDLAVTDHAAGKLLLYSKHGSAIPWLEEPPPFAGPRGLSMVRGAHPLGDYLLVADEGADRVTVLMDARGRALFIRHIDELEGDGTGLSGPMAAVRGGSPIEEVYFIADRGNGRVAKVLIPADEANGPADVWAQVRDSLAGGDFDGALSFFAPVAVETYREIFTSVSDQLDAVVQDMGELLPLEIEGNRAVYGVLRYDGDKPFLFEVTFVRDELREWKILAW